MLFFLLACTDPPPPPAEPPEPAAIELPAPAVWPEEGAPLQRVSTSYPEGFGMRRIYVDPGHGSSGNHGNTGAFCQQEEDFNLRVADQLEEELEGTGHYTVKVGREAGVVRTYSERLAEAADWGAEVYLCIHSDNRGASELWEAAPDLWCPRSDTAEGFTVLYSDEGSLAGERRDLARALGARMAQARFPAYRGEAYEDKYAEEPDLPGVFVDRHVPGQRIMVLRRATMTSAIVETHHAWHTEEVMRWHEPETVEIFATAVAAALADVLPVLEEGQ